MFQTILEDIRKHDRIIIHRHEHPDGDAIGAQVGLKHLILDNFPEKQVYMVGDPAGRYAFMDDSTMDEIPDSFYKGALAFVLDLSAHHLVADKRYTMAEKTIRIDHHISGPEPFCDLELVDTSYESASGLIAQMAQDLGLTIGTVAARSFYTGMVTDSGRFRYDSTSPRTMRLAAMLMERNIDCGTIFENLYSVDFEEVRIRAQFTARIQLTEHRVAYLYNDLALVNSLPLDTFSISRGMVSLMADLKGVEIWVNFTETDQGTVLCELRSSRHNINPIAVKYGGGGHKKASGATLPDRETAMAMLADLDEMMIGE